MKRVSFDRAHCPIARSLDIFGEWWSLLIIRECFLGTTRFDDFQTHLGISKNTLTTRLAKLVERGLLVHVEVEPGARRKHYKLTDQGKDLYPLIVALRQWGDRWTFDGQPPSQVIERATGRPVAEVRVLSQDGRPLKPHETMVFSTANAEL